MWGQTGPSPPSPRLTDDHGLVGDFLDEATLFGLADVEVEPPSARRAKRKQQQRRQPHRPPTPDPDTCQRAPAKQCACVHLRRAPRRRNETGHGARVRSDARPASAELLLFRPRGAAEGRGRTRETRRRGLLFRGAVGSLTRPRGLSVRARLRAFAPRSPYTLDGRSGTTHALIRSATLPFAPHIRRCAPLVWAPGPPPSLSGGLVSGRLGPRGRPDSGSARGGKGGVQAPADPSEIPPGRCLCERARLGCRSAWSGLPGLWGPGLGEDANQPTGDDIPSQWEFSQAEVFLILGVCRFRCL